MDISDEQTIYEFRRCCVECKVSEENYRIYGPANPLKIINSEIPKCSFSGDGICYMMTCQCREDDESDWFTGKCDFCQEKIAERHLAWRLPHVKGGFMGCYCKDHYRTYYKDYNDKVGNIICDIMEIVRSKFPVMLFNEFTNYDEEDL